MGIKRLQRRFIMIATVAVLAVLSVVLLFLNLHNYNSTFRQMYNRLGYIAECGGELRMPMPGMDDTGAPGDPGALSGSFEDIRDFFVDVVEGQLDELSFNAESVYSLRYFSVILDKDGKTKGVNLRHIAAVDKDTASDYAQRALLNGRKRGRFADNGLYYAYVVKNYGAEGGSIVVFMDCTREEEGTLLVIRYSLVVGLLCMLIFILIVSVLSRRAMEPVIRNMETQKAFITNAGHELKTPLAIISANTEVLEMTTGENEWTKSIRNQISRLTVLINNLITLSKTTEGIKVELSDIDFSACTKDACESYRPVIEQQGKKMTVDIEDGIKVRGTKDGLSELVNILLDNAAKYCDENGTVSVELKRRTRNRGVRLSVSNDYAEGANTDYSRFFERFYREDKSHNSKNAGYGIGLSMAKGFAEQFKGKIGVSYKDGVISFAVWF